MAARRLVLNGLTAEVAGGVVTGDHVDCASPEFYHELELYRQLLALPAASATRRSRTPDPPPSYVHDCAPRRCRTPAPRARRTSSVEPSVVCHARSASRGEVACRHRVPAVPPPAGCHAMVTWSWVELNSRKTGDPTRTLRAMAARRLVLNGLTAEEAGGAATGERLDCASPEFYHELELYRQLLALPAACAPRRSRTPDPPPTDTHECTTRRCRSQVPRSRRSSSAPPPAVSHARYLGSFPAGGGEHSARVETVSRRLHLMKEESGHAIPVLVVVALTGVKVCDPEDQSVRMSHALRRISYATCEATRALFAFVAREPRCEPSSQYCHAFETDSPEQAEELNALVGDAFRMAFASQLQPSAPLWSKELSGGSCTRAPDTLPGLTHHYPHCLDRSPSQCDIMGGSKLDPCEASEPSEASEASPSSSEDWNSPTELSCYRRLGERLERMERPPLMKRLALGLSGALLQPSDDDATPLVTDTPTTDPHSSPTNVPLCLNGGYINEASEAEARRERREPRALDKDFRICNNITNGRPNTGSAATSSSSGESSCSRASGNNNNNNNANLRPLEPELRHAPWFQQGIPREIALEVLGAQAPGAFLVRGSTTQTGCLALSLRVPGDFAPLGIAHYLILRTPKGYKIKGFTKEFSSLSALVTHHSVMPELLPVALRLPRRALPRRAERESIDALSRPPTLRPQQDV